MPRQGHAIFRCEDGYRTGAHRVALSVHRLLLEGVRDGSVVCLTPHADERIQPALIRAHILRHRDARTTEQQHG